MVVFVLGRKNWSKSCVPQHAAVLPGNDNFSKTMIHVPSHHSLITNTYLKIFSCAIVVAKALAKMSTVIDTNLHKITRVAETHLSCGQAP